MAGPSRVGGIGIGICPCHLAPVPYITIFATGSPTVSVNNLPVTVISTVGVATCGHPTIALTGSLTVKVENIPMHRAGDMGINCGPYIAASSSADTEVG